MGGYVEDYQNSTDAEKLDILSAMYKTASKEEKTIILDAAAAVYCRLTRKDSKESVLRAVFNEE